MGPHVLPVDGEPRGLVHLAPGRLGPPDPGLLLPSVREHPCGGDAPYDVPPVPRRTPRAGPVRARHVVHLLALALPRARMARRDRGPGPLLPDERPRYRPRHHVLLGR